MKVQRLSRNGVHIKQCGSGEPIRNDSDDIVQTAWKHAEVHTENWQYLANTVECIDVLR